jgi:hypothetical protein
MSGHNYNSVLTGWVYDISKHNYFFNRMRGNIYTLVTESKYEKISDLLVSDTKKPKFETRQNFKQKYEKFSEALGQNLKIS